MILNRARGIPTALSRDDEELSPSSSCSSLVSETTEHLPFSILDATSKSFRKFNAIGRSFLIMFNTPREEQDPTAYLKEYMVWQRNRIAFITHFRPRR